MIDKLIYPNDYYPFGMMMVGRSFSSEGYRFGFNGKENDPELLINDETYDYGMRMTSSRFGRFFSIDPLYQTYPWYSTYQFAGNKPIKYIDLDGKEEYNPQDDGMFSARLIVTTFYDIKHATENLLFRIAPILPGYHLHADYKLDEDGNPIFETEIKLVPNGSFLKETVQTGTDVLMVAMAGKMTPADLLFSKTSGENQFVRAFKGVLADADAFYKRTSKLAVGERISEFRKMANKVAEENNWVRNPILEKKNPGRTIFSDSNGTNYSLDNQHGRFEVLDAKGKHKGEVDFSGMQTKSADPSGKHDIIVK